MCCGPTSSGLPGTTTRGPPGNRCAASTSWSAEPDGATFDPIRAAELEVEWWRLHRLHQYGELTSPDPLIDCLCALYGHVYDTDPESARKAASFRVQAMGISDRWVAHGRPREDPSMVQQRRALVDCYTELRRFIERLDEPPGGVTPE